MTVVCIAHHNPWLKVLAARSSPKSKRPLLSVIEYLPTPLTLGLEWEAEACRRLGLSRLHLTADSPPVQDTCVNPGDLVIGYGNVYLQPRVADRHIRLVLVML